MKIPFFVSVAASGLCLVLSIVLLFLGRTNQGIQDEVTQKQKDIQSQQEQINKGAAITQQVGPNLLRDMAVASIKNDKMKAILTKHGYNVSYDPPATPAPGSGAPELR